MFILMINQSVWIGGLDNHQLCTMQCCLNGVHIGEVSKFLAESPSETTHVIELVNSFDEAHLLIVPLQLSGVNSSFDVYTLNVKEYENKDIPKIHLTALESPWDSQQINIQKKDSNVKS